VFWRLTVPVPTMEHALMNRKRPTSGQLGAGLGTFGGVFTPSVLTILGIILFRRLGFVVGSAGLTSALLMLGLASAISILTSISLSAIATNRKVHGGGDYYIISRTLGVEFGGALGLILFVAQAISVAFYCVGFGEGVASLVGGSEQTVQVSAVLAAVGLFQLAYAGADLATRFQFIIMAILGGAIVSFFVGSQAAWDVTHLEQGWAAGTGTLPFWALFAIFFPAVTGFTQGVSMSGDLANPARSLPVGTFLAVGLSTIVYLVAMVALAAAMPLEDLAGDYDSMKRIAAVPWLIDAGVLAATLSSALASFLGAPRILQALANDRLFPFLNFFGPGHGSNNNPRRGIALTGVIALVTIMLGDLNAIAALVSMFFLVSYGLLNYATYVEAVAASPSFRPRFRFFHARASLAGTALCGLVMLMLDPLVSAIALGVLGALYHYLRWTAVPARWRDSRRAYRFRRVKAGLREIASQPEGPTDWQPHILAFTETTARRERVLQVAGWISGGTGLITAVQLIEGDGSMPAVRKACQEAEQQLATDLESHNLDAYPLVVGVPDLRVGATTLLQAWGVGPIRSNTVLLNWYDSRDPEEKPNLSLWYGRLLQRAARLGQHVVVIEAEETEWQQLSEVPTDDRHIDVWWFEDDSSKLALLLAYLMTRSDDWEEASIRLIAPAPSRSADKVEANLRHRLDELRIEAEITVVDVADDQAMYTRSRDATFVMLPLHLAGMRVLDPTGGSVEELFPMLPVIALVAASGDVKLKEEEPVHPEAENLEQAGDQEPEGRSESKSEEESESAPDS
jgi:amino acid transporter